MRDELGADTAAAAAAILDHHRLAQRLADQIAGYASDSCRKRHNQMNWAVRIGGQGALRRQSQDGRGPERGNKYAAWNTHRSPPNLPLSAQHPGGVQGSIIVPPISLKLNPG
jgi:hypothetical protein